MHNRWVAGHRAGAPGAAQSSILIGALAALALAAGCAEVVTRPVPPRVTLDTVRVARVTGSEARFRLKLVVHNPNPYDLAVSAFDAQLAVEGTPLLTGALADPAVLVAKGDTPIEVEARASLSAVVGALDRLTRERVVRYEVTGSATVQNGWRLPFSRTGELPVGDLLGPRR
jgi:LEA14-like dessication related protein